MGKEYDIFEQINGDPIWRLSVVGLEAAVEKAGDLASSSSNTIVVLHLQTNTVMATMDNPKH
jgi:hypothetical protein